jgi:dTDP-4-dehydrorhamnose reductase
VSLRRVLITGGGGQLASDLVEQLGGSAEVSSRSRAELDITDDAAVAAAFEEVGPDVVFNCAAFHNVEVCETEEDRASEVNVRAVKRLAERSTESGAKFVHLSTNYVFDGTAPDPYTEADLPSPRSVYAFTKLGGEYAALAYAPDALVARTAGLYGLHGSASKGGNFVTRMCARAREQGALKMVSDQRLSPTFTADLAAALIEGVERGAGGITHVTAGGECSWFEFTEAIMELAGIEVPIEPVETTRPPGGADRPLNGVLARDRTDSLGLTPLRHWREGLADYMERAGLRDGGREQVPAPGGDS